MPRHEKPVLGAGAPARAGEWVLAAQVWPGGEAAAEVLAGVGLSLISPLVKKKKKRF